MTTGEKIAALRRKAGMSQEALADQLGISRQAVSKWEADQAVPGMDNLVELGRIFGVPVDTILRPDSRLPESESAEPENAASPGVPLKRPMLTGKIRWFAIAAVLLALAGALCNLVSLIWIGRLQERVEALQAQVNACLLYTSILSGRADITARGVSARDRSKRSDCLRKSGYRKRGGENSRTVP